MGYNNPSFTQSSIYGVVIIKKKKSFVKVLHENYFIATLSCIDILLIITATVFFKNFFHTNVVVMEIVLIIFAVFSSTSIIVLQLVIVVFDLIFPDSNKTYLTVTGNLNIKCKSTLFSAGSLSMIFYFPDAIGVLLFDLLIKQRWC